mmetsp:Transcript_13225/g.32464  ORF Transcript_13225/g.32464 Transcript_13225/m.32464 type:complete len:265 (+) Transcript_13225:103-897(+)
METRVFFSFATPPRDPARDSKSAENPLKFANAPISTPAASKPVRHANGYSGTGINKSKVRRARTVGDITARVNSRRGVSNMHSSLPSIDAAAPPPTTLPPPPPTVRERGRSVPEFHIPNRKGGSLPQGFRLAPNQSRIPPPLVLKQPAKFRNNGRAIAKILSGTAQHVFNEPSRGLFFCKKHMATVVPRLLKVKDAIEEQNLTIESALEDVAANRILVHSLVRVGPKAFDRMGKKLSSLIQGLKDMNPEEVVRNQQVALARQHK